MPRPTRKSTGTVPKKGHEVQPFPQSAAPELKFGEVNVAAVGVAQELVPKTPEAVTVKVEFLCTNKHTNPLLFVVPDQTYCWPCAVTLKLGIPDPSYMYCVGFVLHLWVGFPKET